MNEREFDNAFRNLATQVYALLINTMPVDTGNMVNHTFMQLTEDEIKIVITAPTSKSFDYAYNVNYNLQRGEKERRNYHYVERCLQKANVIIASAYGGNIDGKI